MQRCWIYGKQNEEHAVEDNDIILSKIFIFYSKLRVFKLIF